MVRISISDTKLVEMMVTFQPTRPSRPNIAVLAYRQLAKGSATQRTSRKMMPIITTRNSSTALPKVAISLWMKVIMSSMIIGMPPR